MPNLKPKAVVKKAKAGIASLAMPKHNPADIDQSPTTPKTPKTPADEGIEFFEDIATKGEPIRVYELRLDPDGGPNKDRSVSTVHFPITRDPSRIPSGS